MKVVNNSWRSLRVSCCGAGGTQGSHGALCKWGYDWNKYFQFNQFLCYFSVTAVLLLLLNLIFREVLEAKTRLYDKLNNGNPSATNTKTSQYLIDFDVKHELSRQKSECYSEPNQPPDEADVYDLSNSSDHDSDW